MAIGVTWGEPALRKRADLMPETAPGWYWIAGVGGYPEIAQLLPSGTWLLVGDFRRLTGRQPTILSAPLEPPGA